MKKTPTRTETSITYVCPRCGLKQTWVLQTARREHPLNCAERTCNANNGTIIERAMKCLVTRRRNRAKVSAEWADRGDHYAADIEFPQREAYYIAAREALADVRDLILYATT